MARSIRRGEAGPGRLSRSWRVHRNHSVALPISFAGNAPAGSAGHPMNRRRGALSGTSSMRCTRLSSTRLRRPSSRSGDRIQSLANSTRLGKFPVFPDPGRREVSGRLRTRTCCAATSDAYSVQLFSRRSIRRELLSAGEPRVTSSKLRATLPGAELPLP